MERGGGCKNFNGMTLFGMTFFLAHLDHLKPDNEIENLIMIALKSACWAFIFNTDKYLIVLLQIFYCLPLLYV